MTQPRGIVRLLYVSRNVLEGSSEEMEDEVSSILQTSRRNNARDGVTGALLFNADCFAQALEGEAEAVQEIFERIQLDPRHEATVVLEYGPVGAREFGDWSMAYIGRTEHEAARYAALTGASAPDEAAGQVLGLLRGVVMRSGPG